MKRQWTVICSISSLYSKQCFFVPPGTVVRTLVCLFFALTYSYAAGLGSDRTIAQFAHTAWGAKEGAPGVVTALAQTSTV
jgi:hypothetical protein